MSATFPDRPYSSVYYSYEWRCSFCEETEAQLHMGHRGESAIVPSLPQKWRLIGDRLICQLHSTIALVDGKVIDE
jgi:hypothetical protein